MNESFGHKIDKYALIYCAADEINDHAQRATECVPRFVAFHLMHIKKAATFIKFVETICVIPGGESLLRDDIHALWEAVNKAYDIITDSQWIFITKHDKEIHTVNTCDESGRPAKQIIEVVDKYKRDISGKFESVTAPF